MIKGLKVKYSGSELKAICVERFDAHSAAAKRFQEKLAVLHETKAKLVRDGGTASREEMSAKLDASNFKGEVRGDEVDRMLAHHSKKAKYFGAIKDHLDEKENYLITTEDMVKLEIVENSYG